MDFGAFHDMLVDRLYVTWVSVHPLEGRQIDVGEEFDVQLVVRNRFDEGVGAPDFVDVKVEVTNTGYASLVHESPVVDVAPRIVPGQSVGRVLRFRAEAADLSGSDGGEMEPVALVRVLARADLEALGRIETTSKVLQAHIHGDESPA